MRLLAAISAWAVVALGLWAFGPAVAAAPAGVDSDLTGDLSRVHDPFIIRAGETYYLYSTGTGISVRRSRDLHHWERVGRVFDETPAWAREEATGHLWAPEASYFNGRYHLYYSVSTFGTNRSSIGLATNRTLDPAEAAYRWEDRGRVIQSVPGRDDWNAIDPHVVQAGGKAWMFFGSFWSGIKLLEIDPRTGLAAEAAKLISVAARPREKAIEAPCVVSRGGYYYLFVSFDQACKGADSTYKIMVGRSRDLSGPYLDRRGGPMLKGGGTLVLAGQGRWRGPGHNAVLRDKTGDWLVHHAYDAQNDGAATLRIRPLLWASDGWPLAGECGVPAAGTGGAVRAEDVAGSWECSTDFGEPRRVVLQPGGRVEGIDGGASWSLSGRRLLIRRRDPQAPGGARTDECLLGPGGAWYVGRDEGGAVLQGRKAAPS